MPFLLPPRFSRARFFSSDLYSVKSSEGAYVGQQFSFAFTETLYNSFFMSFVQHEMLRKGVYRAEILFCAHKPPDTVLMADRYRHGSDIGQRDRAPAKPGCLLSHDCVLVCMDAQEESGIKEKNRDRYPLPKPWCPRSRSSRPSSPPSAQSGRPRPQTRSTPGSGLPCSPP